MSTTQASSLVYVSAATAKPAIAVAWRNNLVRTYNINGNLTVNLDDTCRAFGVSGDGDDQAKLERIQTRRDEYIALVEHIRFENDPDHRVATWRGQKIRYRFDIERDDIAINLGDLCAAIGLPRWTTIDELSSSATEDDLNSAIRACAAHGGLTTAGRA